jgi:hypothetical protein
MQHDPAGLPICQQENGYEYLITGRELSNVVQ